jgi:hypothetical protein
LLTGMTGISLHMQWPLTSQLRGSVSQREQLFFYVMDQNPHPFRCLPRIHEWKNWLYKHLVSSTYLRHVSCMHVVQFFKGQGNETLTGISFRRI